MFYILFAIYLLFFCWLITRIKIFKESGIGKYFLIGLFLIRILVALVNGYINIYYGPVTDVNHFQIQGIEEYYLLFHNTREYFTDIFHNTHSNGFGNFLESSDSFWNDTRSNIIVKMLSIFDIFSGKNFFINSLFYNFFIFFGSVALYKVFRKLFPTYTLALVACIFLLPSFIYFSSAVHREGLIYLSLSMIIYHVYFMMESKIYPFKKIVITLLFLILILLIRNFVFIALVPALISWIISEQQPKYAYAIFFSIYLLMGVIFFASSFLPPAYNLPAHVSSRQIDFIEIAKHATSAININPLYPNFRSFLNNLPQAFNHAFMRPYITEHLNFFYIPAGLEILFYEILFLFFIFFRKRNITVPPLIYFSIFLTLTILLMIGYTISIIGAIVRYRSIYFPLVIIPLVCYTNWKRVKTKVI